jgi:hypothetical protein
LNPIFIRNSQKIGWCEFQGHILIKNKKMHRILSNRPNFGMICSFFRLQASNGSRMTLCAAFQIGVEQGGNRTGRDPPVRIDPKLEA